MEKLLREIEELDGCLARLNYSYDQRIEIIKIFVAYSIYNTSRKTSWVSVEPL